jgi:hypothetical protein
VFPIGDSATELDVASFGDELEHAIRHRGLRRINF